MAALIASAIAMPAAAQQQTVDADAAGRPATDSAGYYKASDLIGMPVQGADNQELGKVADLLVDGATNQIDYLILDTTSVADLSGQLPIVPWVIADTRYVDNSSTFIINIPLTIDRIRTAPMVTIADLDLRGSPGWRTQVNDFYATDVQERRVARPELDRDTNDRDANRDEPNRAREGQRPRKTENTPDAGNRPDSSPKPDANTPNTPNKPSPKTDAGANKPKADAPPKADAKPQPKTDASPKPDANRKPNPEKKPATP